LPHSRNGRFNLDGIGYRKRAALTDTYEGRVSPRGLQLFLGWVRWRYIARARRAKNNTVEIGQF